MTQYTWHGRINEIKLVRRDGEVVIASMRVSVPISDSDRWPPQWEKLHVDPKCTVDVDSALEAMRNRSEACCFHIEQRDCTRRMHQRTFERVLTSITLPCMETVA